jgi:hypothetical protein
VEAGTSSPRLDCYGSRSARIVEPVLRANVVRPPGGERCPVVLSIHPYGKDNLPTRRGKRWTYSFQYTFCVNPSRHRLIAGTRPIDGLLRRPLAGTMCPTNSLRTRHSKDPWATHSAASGESRCP